eukprot:s71_g15.t1
MSRIDIHQDDRGLASCFTGANIKKEWSDAYVAAHHVTTLDDFVYMVKASDWEQSLGDLLAQVTVLKDNRIAEARFKSAYEAGLQALKHAAQSAPKTEDLDEALPDTTIQQLNSDWTRRYNLSFDSVLEPSEQLRGRIYREFKKGTMTVVEMKKVRSVLTMSQPRTSSAIDLPGGLQLQLEKEVAVSLRSVTDYYFAMRVLAHAWAWAGNWLMQVDKQSVLFMDLSSALHYCDRALRDTMEFGQGSLTWLQRNDALTRGKMATYIRRGQPGQWALDNALRETHLEWRSPAVQPLAEIPESRPAKRSPDGPSAGSAPKRAVKGDTFRTVSQVKGGYSGLCLALLQLGLHFYAVAAECDDTARLVAQSNMPNLVHVTHVESLTATAFVPFLRRRKVRGVLMGGGSPCQGNTSLNLRRRGLSDPRSCQPLELQRLREEFLALPEMQSCELVTFLENVGSMPASVRASYSSWLGGLPIQIDAASCGWVQRRRLYWLVSRAQTLGSHLSPPSSWDWVPLGDGSLSLRYVGDKPLPNKCFFHHSYQPLLDPKEVMKADGVGAMHPFTREFFHPTDRTSGSSPEAVARFLADDRRFPPSAYEERSLLWKDSQWRQPLPSERAQLMGVPPESFNMVPGDGPLRRQRQNSLLGNGFHLFSVLALMCFLPQILEAKMSPHLSSAMETELHARLLHTVWEPGRLSTFPGLLTAADIVRDLPGLFPDCVLSLGLLDEVRHRLSHCDLAKLQGYYAWSRLRGLSVDDLGPYPLSRLDRAKIFSGLTGQRHAADSSKGLDHLLPSGLGKDGHIDASSRLPSPFQATDWPEPDAVFVIEAICAWRQFLPAYAQQLRTVLKSVAVALAPLEDALQSWRVESAHRVASSKRPGFVSALTLLLRWPDLRQGHCLVRGYPIVGEIDSSGLFRPLPACAFQGCPFAGRMAAEFL